jgi:hypothetical protein
MKRARPPKRPAHVLVAALLAPMLAACSTETKDDTAKPPAKPPAETPARTPAETSSEPAPEPLSTKELKALVLTTAQTPSGFEVYRTVARKARPLEGQEVVRPKKCAVLRNPELKASVEASTARAILERPTEGLDRHTIVVAGWSSEADARTRMAALREALGGCGSIQYENTYAPGTREARLQPENAPELGDEALRYTENGPTSYQGLTVVRVRDVIVYVKADTLFGFGTPLSAAKRKELTPGFEEKLVRAQVDKVQRTLDQGSTTTS